MYDFLCYRSLRACQTFFLLFIFFPSCTTSKIQLVSQILNLKIVHVLPHTKYQMCRNSEFSFYIKSLPREFSLPLFWSTSHFRQLEGSTALAEALALYEGCCRQYAYLFSLLTVRGTCHFHCLCHHCDVMILRNHIDRHLCLCHVR